MLAGLLALATAWAVVSGGWNSGLLVTLPVAAAAALGAALLALAGVPRLLPLALVVPAAVAVVVPLTLADMPPDQGPATLLHIVARYVPALATGVVSSQSWSFIVGLSAGMWLLGSWVGWMSVRERAAVLAAAPCWMVLASDVLNAPRPERAALPIAVALALSVALVARTELVALESRWRAGRLVAMPGTRRRYLTAAAVAGGGALVVGLALPSISSTDYSGRLFHFTVNDLGKGGSGSGGTAPGRSGAIGFNPVVEPGGALVDDPQPVLSYTVTYAADDHPPVYLRATTDVHVQAGVWTPDAPGGAGAFTREPAGAVLRDSAVQDLTTAAETEAVTVRYTLAAGVTAQGLALALFDGEPASVDRPHTTLGFGSGQGLEPGVLAIDSVSLGRLAPSGAVTTVGLIPEATAEQLRAAPADVPRWLAAGGYLDVGATGASGQRQLTDIAALAEQWTAGATNAFDRARAVETRLRSAPYQYTLTPPAAAAGEWPVHAFLMTTHAGYCQYYASAMGLMLRLLGIPTRLVSGYGPGTPDDAQSTPRSTVYRVTSSDAHVWVEAYMTGHGWIPFEPTPSSQEGIYDPVPRPGGAAASGATDAPAAGANPSTPEQDAGPAAFDGGSSTATTVPGWLVGGVAGVLLAGGVLVGIALWFGSVGGTGALDRRLRLAGRCLGVRRRPSDTAAMHVARIRAALPPDGVSALHPRGGGVPWRRHRRERTEARLGVVAELAGKARYSRGGLDRLEAIRLRRAWRGVASALPGLAWRRAVHAAAGGGSGSVAARAPAPLSRS